jgi:proton-dependent oligopeptide transporter, POT family
MHKNPVLLIASTEMLERFSYYGTVSILVVFLSTNLGFSDTQAYSTSALFGAIGFALPILGGIMADAMVGMQYMIILGGLLMVIGHLLMAFSTVETTVHGLALIAVGTGLFKGNITVLLGSCYEAKDSRRSYAFSIFYSCISAGALASSITCAYVYQNWGPSWSFAAAGAGICLGLSIFLTFRRTLGDVGLTSPLQLKFRYKKLLVLLATLLAYLASRHLIAHSEQMVKLVALSGAVFFFMYVVLVLQHEGQARNKLIVLGFLLIFSLAFYAFQSQIYFAISLFAKRSVDTNLFGHQVPSTAFQAIPPVSAAIFGILRSARHKNLEQGILELGLGLVGPVICFAALSFGCFQCKGDKISCIYLLSTALIGVSEMLIGPFVYNQATLLAPTRLKGYAMSFVLIAIAFGNLATVLITRPISLNAASNLSASLYARGFGMLALVQTSVLCLFCITFYLMRSRINGAGLN